MTDVTQTGGAIFEMLRSRKSSRAFATTPVETDKIHRLLEAARWAPSARNNQPWRFVVAPREQTDVFEGIVSTLLPHNAGWAANAALFIVVVVNTAWDADGSPNPYASYDTGGSVAHLTVQAIAEGLTLRQIGTFYSDSLREVIALPDTFKPITLLAVGYPGEVTSLPEEYRSLETAPRTRKPLRELAFQGKWGEPLK
ncbi:MAG: nitroreductase family protein [Capsulimonadaceae bacterium]|nr:nitroreductase family protein [Capsulimonadaceae bacterium]